MTIPKISAQAVVKLTKGSSDAKILSAPVVLTTDNKEAKISSGEQVPISQTTYNSSIGAPTQSGTQYKDATLDLAITPHINPQNFVLMDIVYSETQVLEDGTKDLGPKLSTRKMNATIAVDDRSTVVLGGLVKTRDSKKTTGIPLLSDIPLIGRLFSQRESSGARSELIVLITPYVLTTPEQAKAITERIHLNSNMKTVVWPRGWSQSPLRNDEPAKEDWKKKKGKKDKATGEEASNAVPVAVSDEMQAE
jgi:general secretion pathway protein D